MSEETTAALAMQKITDHIDACATNYKTLRDAIAGTNRLLISFISGVFAVVVVFAGYTYVHDQSVSSELNDAKVAAASAAKAVSYIPDETAQKLRSP